MTPTPRPTPGVSRAYAFPVVERATLSNGIRVAVARMPRLPLVAVQAVADKGASTEARGTEGIAQLTSRTMREGTTRLDGAVLTEQLEMLGTGLDLESDWDSTGLQLTVTSSRLEAATSLLGELWTSPGFRENDVARIRAERLAEILQLTAEPRGLADEKFSEFLYEAGSRYALPAGGTAKSVRGLGRSGIRAFHAANYSPDTTRLVFVGDVTIERAVPLVEAALGMWRGATRSRDAPAADMATRVRRVEVVNKTDAPQSELRVGHRGVPRRHPEYFSILVMNALLGGLFSSRINMNLRERNAFTYGAHSAFDWRVGAGPFVVSTAVKTEVTAEATGEILREITRFREETVGTDELTLATAYLGGVFPIRYETIQAVAEAIAMLDTYDLGHDYFDRYRDRVRSVTSDEVRRAAEAHLHPDELLVLAVGDAGAIRGPLEHLALGPVKVHDVDDEGAVS